MDLKRTEGYKNVDRFKVYAKTFICQAVFFLLFKQNNLHHRSSYSIKHDKTGKKKRGLYRQGLPNTPNSN